MGNTYLVFERVDGTIALHLPLRDSRHFQEDTAKWFTAVEVWHRHCDPNDREALRLDDAVDIELPNPYFRACWRKGTGGKIKVDLPLARTQRMAEIREERNAKFPPLDAEWMKAIGQENTTAAAGIETKRQLLRDIPQTINLGTKKSAASLEAFQPTWPE